MEEKDKNKKRLIVIDGNHLVHRAFHAIRHPLQTSSGEPTNAVYGFASMILNILDQEAPDYFVFAFDEHGPTFRHEMHSEYKGTRTKAPDELYVQIPRIKEMLNDFNAVVLSKKGYEADDIMGTLAKQADEAAMISYLVTGDMDLLQLVNNSTLVVFPHKGYKQPTFYDREGVFKKYQIYPEQVVDYKALVGDSSDNIKGVPGIGPKGASHLLANYKTLDGIYDHLSDLSDGMKKKLVEGQDSAYFSRSLAKIVTDIPIDFHMKDSTFESLDFSKLLRFFEKMEMKSLQNRLKRTIPSQRLQSENQMSLF